MTSRQRVTLVLLAALGLGGELACITTRAHAGAAILAGVPLLAAFYLWDRWDLPR